MNLELLDPFGSVPDRVDATLVLPENKDAAYVVSYNRRGTYLAVGYANGYLGIFSTETRNLVFLYHTPDVEVSNVSWSRRSRHILVAGTDSRRIYLLDVTHPAGTNYSSSKVCGLDWTDFQYGHKHSQTQYTSFVDCDQQYEMMSRDCYLTTIVYNPNEHMAANSTTTDTTPPERSDPPPRRYPSVSFDLYQPVLGSVQIHPKLPMVGMAVLRNYDLVLFCWPEPCCTIPNNDTKPVVRLVVFATHITCSCFNTTGDRIFGATKQGDLVQFDVSSLWDVLRSPSGGVVPTVRPVKTTRIGTECWHVMVSKNGKHIVVNGSDGVIRLFSPSPNKNDDTNAPPPTLFKDAVTKIKFASCSLSGDSEYLVAGANGADDKYEIYIWEKTSGNLMDKLTGSSTRLYAVGWHPTRSFLAVACEDGIIDIWGPRKNWMAFAPDFQALPMNVEYIEREDEFDMDEKGQLLAKKTNLELTSEDDVVDVMKIENVPVFESDSEDEQDVFRFKPIVKNLINARGPKKSKETGDD